MIVKGYAVFDSAANAFLPLFFLRSHGEAVRSFLDAVRDEKHQFYAHRADYVLFHMCDYDDTNGLVWSPKNGPEKLMAGLDVGGEG